MLRRLCCPRRARPSIAPCPLHPAMPPDLVAGLPADTRESSALTAHDENETDDETPVTSDIRDELKDASTKIPEDTVQEASAHEDSVHEDSVHEEPLSQASQLPVPRSPSICVEDYSENVHSPIKELPRIDQPETARPNSSPSADLPSDKVDIVSASTASMGSRSASQTRVSIGSPIRPVSQISNQLTDQSNEPSPIRAHSQLSGPPPVSTPIRSLEPSPIPSPLQSPVRSPVRSTLTSPIRSPAQEQKRSQKTPSPSLSSEKISPISKIKIEDEAKKCSPRERDVRNALAECTAPPRLDDWEATVRGLREAESLARDPAARAPAAAWRATARVVASHVRALRSRVARAACSALGALFESRGRLLDPETEEAAGALLERAADANRFLRADAEEALIRVACGTSVARGVTALARRGVTHRAGAVRSAAARALTELVMRGGVARALELAPEPRALLLRAAADLLADANPDARAHARRLCVALSEDSRFRPLLKESLPPSKYRTVEQSVDRLRCR